MFLNRFINVLAPQGMFSPESIQNLIALYGEEGRDGAKVIRTIYLRQDNSDSNSRRAASPENEDPQILEDGRILLVGIDPTEKIYNAVISGELPGVEIIE